MMAKDKSVTISLGIVAIAIFLSLVGVLPKESNGQPWYFILLHILTFVAMARLCFVLPLQTLIHAIKHEPQDARVKWVLAHLFLWPLAGIPYYYLTEKY